jgi:hypothetical protein
VTYVVDRNRGKSDERGAEQVVLAEVVADDRLLARAAGGDRQSLGEMTERLWRDERLPPRTTRRAPWRR